MLSTIYTGKLIVGGGAGGDPRLNAEGGADPIFFFSAKQYEIKENLVYSVF